MTLHRVAWTNTWNRSAAAHRSVGTLLHLTNTAAVTGTTLCGKTYPADKGFPGQMKPCKACLKAAGVTSTAGLPFVMSVEEQ